MIVRIDEDTAVNLASVTKIARDSYDGDSFHANLVDENKILDLDEGDLQQLISASAPVTPGGGWAVLQWRFDIFGLPVVTPNPVIAWRVLPRGAEPIVVTPLRQKPQALLSPHGFVHVLATGEALRPAEWGARLIFEQARRDGRVLKAPAHASGDDPLDI